MMNCQVITWQKDAKEEEFYSFPRIELKNHLTNNEPPFPTSQDLSGPFPYPHQFRILS